MEAIGHKVALYRAIFELIRVDIFQCLFQGFVVGLECEWTVAFDIAKMLYESFSLNVYELFEGAFRTCHDTPLPL